MKLRAYFLLAALALAGCGGDEHRDLKEELANLTKDMRGRVDPLPQVKPYEPVPYTAYDQPDPFGPTKIVLATKGGGASSGTGSGELEAVAAKLVPPNSSETSKTTASGVIFVTYSSTDSPDSLKGFYENAISQTGWQTISTTKYEVTGRGGKGRELLQRGQFTRVIPQDVENPPPLTE